MDLNATILGQCISFILFVWFCMKYIWPKIIYVIECRKKQIIQIHSNLEKVKQDIKLAKLKSLNIIKKSKKKADLIIQDAEQNKYLLLEEAKRHAQEERKRILEYTLSEINIQKEKIKNELIDQTNHLAIEIANKIIKHSFKYKDYDGDFFNKLVNNF
ncbi:ATP synthase subunit b [Buchnera aphidicola (Pterocallis alni)]|uniref:F0F1 ATP synthase subunit B n=1 Tax=Buchnera aphidicola TaxID=9 RepID=UPI003464CCA0